MYPELFVPIALFFVITSPTYRCPSPLASARMEVMMIQPVAEKYVVDHPKGPCPGVRTLIEAGELSRASVVVDPWGGEYAIRCRGEDDVRVVSAGPDRWFDTADDVASPVAP